jgi:multiple sugar transport system substrate-binding protein
MKRIVLLLIGVLVLGMPLFASGQSGGQASTAGKTVVSILKWGTIEEDPDANIVRYEREHPDIKIDMVVVPFEDYPQKLATLQAAGELPDILALEEHRVLEYGSLGIIKDLRAEFSARGLNIDDHYIAGQMFKSGDKVYGTGAAGSMILMFYNKKLLQQAGIAFPSTDVTRPWNWDQFLSAAQKLTKDNRGRTPVDPGFDLNNVVQWGARVNGWWLYTLPWLYSAGSSMANAEGTALEITKPAGIDAMQKWADLTNRYHVGAPDGTFPSTTAALMNDQVGIMFEGQWAFGDFTKEGYDVGYAQIPSISGKASNMVWGAAMVLTSKASSAAFDYFYWTQNTARDIENMEAWNAAHSVQQQYSGVVLTKNIASDPTLQARLDKISNPAFTTLLADIADKGSRVGENITLKNFSQILYEHVQPAVELLMTGDVTAQEAFKNLDVNTRSLFQGTY